MEWIKIRYRLPKLYDHVIIHFNGMVGEGYRTPKYFVWGRTSNIDFKNIKPTHWMPLPKLPKDK